MAEKKTFKDPEVCPYAAGQWTVRELNGKTHGLFSSHEWDMEVTFTKKVPTFKPGWFLYSDVPEGYDKEIEYFAAPPPNNGWERVYARN